MVKASLNQQYRWYICFLVSMFLYCADTTASSCGDSLEQPLFIHQQDDVAWLPLPNKTSWVLSDALPEDAPITAAYVLAQHQGKYLMGLHNERGWDILGGHVDPGESPQEAARREAHEETGATVDHLKLFAYQKLEILGPKPDHYKYPYPVSYQALYLGEVTELGTFEKDEDMTDRRLFSYEEAVKEVAWTKHYPDVFESAEIAQRAMAGKNTVLGNGSYDPYHWGHDESVKAAMTAMNAGLAVVTGNNPNQNKPQRSEATVRTAMMRLHHKDDPGIFISSLPIHLVTKILRGRTTMVGVLGSDQVFRHLDSGKPPKMEVDRWVLIQRQDTPVLSDLKSFFGKPAHTVPAEQLHQQGHSSTAIKSYLADHLEIYADPRLAPAAAVPLHPAVLQYITARKLYYPHALVDQITADIRNQFKTLSGVSISCLNETSQSGLSGALVFLAKDLQGRTIAVIKTFLGSSRDKNFFREINGITLSGQLSIGFISQGPRYNLLSMSAAPGTEMRRNIQALTIEAKQNPEYFGHLLEHARQISFAVGQRLARLHKRRERKVTLLPSDHRLRRLSLKAEALLKGSRTIATGNLFQQATLLNKLKERLTIDSISIGTIHGDANPGNFFYEDGTEAVTMVDLGGFNNKGLLDYEFFQFIASIHRLENQGSLDHDAILKVIGAFENGYTSKRPIERNTFFEVYWKLRTQLSKVRK